MCSKAPFPLLPPATTVGLSPAVWGLVTWDLSGTHSQAHRGRAPSGTSPALSLWADSFLWLLQQIAKNWGLTTTDIYPVTVPEAKSPCSLQRLQGRLCFLPRPAFGGFCIPWLVATSLHFLPPSSHLLFPSLPSPLWVSYEDTCHWIEDPVR